MGKKEKNLSSFVDVFYRPQSQSLEKGYKCFKKCDALDSGELQMSDPGLYMRWCSEVNSVLFRNLS